MRICVRRPEAHELRRAAQACLARRRSSRRSPSSSRSSESEQHVRGSAAMFEKSHRTALRPSSRTPARKAVLRARNICGVRLGANQPPQKPEGPASTGCRAFFLLHINARTSHHQYVPPRVAATSRRRKSVHGLTTTSSIYISTPAPGPSANTRAFVMFAQLGTLIVPVSFVHPPSDTVVGFTIQA